MNGDISTITSNSQQYYIKDSAARDAINHLTKDDFRVESGTIANQREAIRTSFLDSFTQISDTDSSIQHSSNNFESDGKYTLTINTTIQ